MSDLEAFRAEARAWLEENAPEGVKGIKADELNGVWGGKRCEFEVPDQKVWLERMGAKGWTAPMWPAEYGGGGLSKAESKILSQEMKALDLPPALIGFGLTMIGPTLLQFGTEEQKKEHLPRIVRGEIRWCQGYSEPGAGSDLASLQTKAERDGDDFIINGTKVWTSYADKADWIFALVRNDNSGIKQEGITFLLIDMDDPGVNVSPILLISGKSPFCETHFTDVRVPVKNVIHEIGAGWTVAKALLGHERTMIADTFGSSAGATKKAGERSFLSSLAVERVGEREGRISDPIIRDDVAKMEMETRAFGLTTQRTADAAKAGHNPGPESSMFKLYGTELNKTRMELMVRILGPDALGWEGDGFDEFALGTTRDWLRSRGNSIEGGTSEVQLNVIAKRVLGLPA
ncbi:MAG: acyl-CoA dehydrogenase family protein [Myxococcota bacterium]|nr:acyl-CoA dehydrogenase [Deltaproteobacteria bacterium]